MNLWIAFCWAGTIGLLFANISHGLLDVGNPNLTVIITVVAIECSICILSSAIISICTGPGDRKKYFALVAVVPLAVCMYVSYEASVRVFVKVKHEQIAHEEKGPDYSLYRNDAVGANNALIAMEKQGIYSGEAYDKQTKKKRDALEKLKGLKTSESSTTKALTANGKSVDESALNNARIRSAAMILLAVTFSYLAGLWTTILSAAKLARAYEFGGSSRAKKPQGSSQPKQKEAVELVDMGEEETTPTPAKTLASQPLPMKKEDPPAKAGKGGSVAKSTGVDKPNKVTAKKIAAAIKAGNFVRANGRIASDKLSQSDMGSRTASKGSQAAIMGYLEEMGVIVKQGGKRAALITDEYRPNSSYKTS